ncbi:MAG: AAA family ATPase [Desulfobacterales bacterium]
MHIKRLEIIGFKSFPDKCTIDFPAGISAIVGPNGCGKSNIIDAIKWVMGEQSIKQLRGKSMGDVIFSGTEKRPPLNMAEVSMTLSNDTSANTDDGFAQFTELMITRRLYRSGESAYLINKQPCRLKDIHHVFLGSGMGAQSCAIVQQGNIGAITDATPEERRTFIEEAAGVTRYKIRKNEAISKVTATNQNLLRLDDIIDEIKKQMNSLRRQARKALRYKDFRDGLKKSDMLVSVYYHEHFSGQMDDAQTLLSELKGKNTSHASELKKLDSALEKIKSDRVAREQVISERKSEKANAERQIETGKNELSYLKNEEKRLTEEIGDLETATRNLAFKNEKIDDEIAQESVKIKNLEIRYEETRVDLNAQVMSTSDIREALGERQKKLDAQKKALMTLMTQKAKFQSIFQNAAKNKENLRQQLQRVQKRKQILQNGSKRLNTRLPKRSRPCENNRRR